MSEVIKGVNIINPISTNSPVAKANADVIIEFFSSYVKKNEGFYSLWVEENPIIITPFVMVNRDSLSVNWRSGWEEVKKFFGRIIFEWEGVFDWTIHEFIVGEDPNTIITKATSKIDMDVGGGKRVAYNGVYIQIFKFIDNKVKSFEEYYDTELLRKSYE